MSQVPTNVINTTPDFLVGVEGGNLVLVPRGLGLAGATNSEDLAAVARITLQALAVGGGIPRTSTLAHSLSGYLPAALMATGANIYNEMAALPVSAHFNAVRVGVFNASTSAVAGVKAVVASGTTCGVGGGGTGNAMGLQTSGFIGRPIGGVLNQRVCSWGDDATATTVTLPAAIPTAPAVAVGVGSPEASLTFSDWMSCPSLDRADPVSGLEPLPMVFVGVVWPAGVSRTYLTMERLPSGSGDPQGATLDVEGSPTVAPYGRPYRVVKNWSGAARDAAADAGFWVGSGQTREYTQFPAIVIEYQLRDGRIGRQFLNFDDSISEINEGGVARFTWPREMQRMVSTMANPVEIANFAISSSTMDMWYNKAKVVLPHFSNCAVISKNWSVNNMNVGVSFPSDTDLAGARWNLGRMQALVDQQKNMRHVVRTTDPATYAAKPFGRDFLRVNWNTLTANAVGLNPIDTATATSQSAADVNGQVNPIAAYIDGGGVHYTTAGHVAIGTAAALALPNVPFKSA